MIKSECGRGDKSEAGEPGVWVCRQVSVGVETSEAGDGLAAALVPTPTGLAAARVRGLT